jgi:hypothetical protein
VAFERFLGEIYAVEKMWPELTAFLGVNLRDVLNPRRATRFERVTIYRSGGPARSPEPPVAGDDEDDN